MHFIWIHCYLKRWKLKTFSLNFQKPQASGVLKTFFKKPFLAAYSYEGKIRRGVSRKYEERGKGKFRGFHCLLTFSNIFEFHSDCAQYVSLVNDHKKISHRIHSGPTILKGVQIVWNGQKCDLDNTLPNLTKIRRSRKKYHNLYPRDNYLL